jgi:hypothetical protein
MTTLDQKIAEAQAEWDAATNAYSRYPGTEEWQTFLDAKKKVYTLKGLLKTDNAKPLKGEMPTDKKVEEFLRTVPESNYPEIIEQCHITKDQLRHALLKLLKDQRIEKVRTGRYRIKN